MLKTSELGWWIHESSNKLPVNLEIISKYKVFKEVVKETKCIAPVWSVWLVRHFSRSAALEQESQFLPRFVPPSELLWCLWNRGPIKGPWDRPAAGAFPLPSSQTSNWRPYFSVPYLAPVSFPGTNGCREKKKKKIVALDNSGSFYCNCFVQ